MIELLPFPLIHRTLADNEVGTARNGTGSGIFIDTTEFDMFVIPLVQNRELYET